ncbi:hypothetical protein C8Q73DRAFT_793557 [Cubamyces lactineus]|nr:hypothetical protein C8Q73DRAFT_793557 [Cubamyces lactineus]
MVIAFLRAFLASFLPLLLVKLHLDGPSLTDWTRSLPRPHILHHLPPGPSEKNATTITGSLSEDLFSLDTIGDADHTIAYLNTIHPVFEAVATIVSQLRSKLTSPPLSFTLSDMPLFWVSVTILISLPILVSVFEYLLSSLCNWWRTPCPSPVSHYPALAISRTLRLSSSSSPLFSAKAALQAPKASAESATTLAAISDDPVAHLLESWDGGHITSDSIRESAGSSHMRSLSDIVEQSEPEERDARNRNSSGDDTATMVALKSEAPRCETLPGAEHSVTTQVGPSELSNHDLVAPETEATDPAPLACERASPSELSERLVSPTTQITVQNPSLVTLSPTETSTPGQDAPSGGIPAHPVRTPIPRSRRVPSVVVSRTGLVGHQVNLTASGIDYVASQLPAGPAASVSMAREDRRRLQSVARDAVAVFSENRGAPPSRHLVRRERAETTPTPSRIALNLIDGRENPPLTSGSQVMRPLLEVGRSRSGTGTVVTPLVALERSTTLRQGSGHTHDKSSSVANGTARGSMFSKTARATPPTQVFHAMSSVQPASRSAVPLTYAAITAKPATSPFPPLHNVLERTSSAGAVSPSNSARGNSITSTPDQALITTDGRKRVPKAFTSYLSTLIVPVPHEDVVPAAKRRRETLNRQASNNMADSSKNWRIRRLAGDQQLNAEFALSPTPTRPSCSHLNKRGSLFSATARAQLRDLAALAQTRSDIVPEPSPTARQAPQGRAGEDHSVVLLRGEHRQNTPSPSQRMGSPVPTRIMFGANTSRVRQPSPLGSVVSTPGDIFSSNALLPRPASSARTELALQQPTASSGSGLCSGMPQSISGDLVLCPRSGVRSDVDSQTGRPKTPAPACLVGSVATSSSCLTTIRDAVVPGSSSSAPTEAFSGDPQASSVGEPSAVSKSPGSTPSASLSHDCVYPLETKSKATATAATLTSRTHQWQLTVWHPKPSSSTAAPRALLVVSRVSDGKQHPGPLSVISTNLPEDAWPRLRQSTAPAAPVESFDSVRKRVKAHKRDKEQRHAQAVEAKSSAPPSTGKDAALRPDVAFQPSGRYASREPESGPSADILTTNRGHQTAPYVHLKRRRPATAERRLRATSANVSTASWSSGSAAAASARKRTTTGSRFDVLDSDVLLL